MKIDVIVEITKGSRNKYEINKETGRVKFDRVLRSSVAYPADYGMVPNTLCDDGDPLDVLIINRFPTFPGCEVSVRPLGVFKMVDTGENDEKIIAVAEKDYYFENWKDLKDVHPAMLAEIEEFFMTYKNLEKGKTVASNGWGDAKEAEKVIKDSIAKVK